MNVIGVIGAAFGDEGKGRMVHALASKAKQPCIVVRYNGGPQAAHTVVTEDGKAHIFHHFGSGTMAGAATYLSAFFIANPLIWRPEQQDLQGLGLNPRLYASPNAPLTTPYDMIINRESERAKGLQRHGSCGYGVNETVERLCKTSHKLFVRDIPRKDFVERVESIRNQHVPERLKALGLTASDNMREACASPELLEEFLSSSNDFYKAQIPMLDSELHRWETVIFEGSQGLCLDEEFRFFPHVTRSRTGIPNIVEICASAGIESIEAVYVTRTYTTRHGHGPLPTEVAGLQYDDPTNLENEWQGAIRFGSLDLDLIQEAVKGDRAKGGGVKVKCSLAVTCMDQVGESVDVHYKGKAQSIAKADLPALVAKAVGAKQVYLSWKR